jgi:hypothetical protein
MKLIEYIDSLLALIGERPEVAEYIVVTADDDEGNTYSEICTGVTVGIFSEFEFLVETEIQEVGDEPNMELMPEDSTLAVCVN